MTDPAKANDVIVTLTSDRGEYELHDEIGSGGMGKVYGATFKKGGMYRANAIKVLHGALALTADARKRMLAEAQIACQLSHPNIVPVTDIGMIGDAPFIVMERVDGVNLRKFLEAVGEPLDLDICDWIKACALDAASYLHDRKIGQRNAGVVHSDITPGNIIISSRGEVKLTDFGIARFAHMEGTRTRPIGTPRYMPPEQRLGKTPPGVDLFAVGMIDWELLEGRRMHANLDDLQFTHALLNGDIPPITRRGVEDWQIELNRDMLSPDPERRPRAKDAYALIILKRPNLLGAKQKLADLYREHIGPERSGMTKLLNVAEFFGDPASSPVRITLDSAFSAPSAPPTERTVADSGEADAPAVFRRARSPSDPSNELTPGATRVTGVTGTETPLTHARVSGVDGLVNDEPELPPMLAHEPQPAAESWLASINNSGQPFESTKTDEPDVEPTIVLDPPSFVEPTGEELAPGTSEQPVPTAHASSQPIVEPATPVGVDRLTTAPVTELRRRTAALWVLAAGVGVLIILVAVQVVLSVASKRDDAPASLPDVEAGTPAADVGRVEPSSVEPPPVDPQVESVSAVEVEDSAQPEHADSETNLEPLAGSEGDDETVESTAETNPATEHIEKKERTPKPPPPRFDVLFMIPDGAQAEIEIGKTRIKGTSYATTKLRINTYPVRWRTLPDGEWHSVGKLTIEEPPAGKGFQVNLKTTSMSVSHMRVGGGSK